MPKMVLFPLFMLLAVFCVILLPKEKKVKKKFFRLFKVRLMGLRVKPTDAVG
jgi:hypothetical protein